MGHRLIGFAGLPGVGKSAIVTGVARASGVRVLAVDPIEEGLAAAGYDAGPNRLDSAYLVAARQAEHRLSFGQRVIMEACNAEPERRAIWREVAVRAGVPGELGRGALCARGAPAPSCRASDRFSRGRGTNVARGRGPVCRP